LNTSPQPDTPFESFLETDAPDSSALPVSDSIDDFVQQIKETADKLIKDGATRGDAKLLAHAMKELRHCFRVFANYRGIRKATVFGSARTPTDSAVYRAAVEFGQRMTEAGWMTITGAASGIMEAGNVGAGREMSFGLNILLPFEQGANTIIDGDPKLMNMRYFFTRKLMLIKESDAAVLFPGGFGTHDEGFETLTLIQTGKSHVFPVVMIDEPGGTYWKRWLDFVKDDLLKRGYISPADLSLFLVTDSVDAAAREVMQFYHNYHSMRYVRGELVLRLQQRLPDTTAQQIARDFTDIMEPGTLEQCAALPQEMNEPAIAHLPRLKFRFDRHSHGRLRELINVVNA